MKEKCTFAKNLTMDFGMLGNMQEQLQAVKEKLDTIMVEGEAGDGNVKVTTTASKRIENISIAQELIAEGDKEQIEDLLVVALNRALDKADVTSATEMQQAYNDIMPGLGGMSSLFGG